jgi:8-oxo-dGTP pyrophosphatase MutT (NUDIX family)
MAQDLCMMDYFLDEGRLRPASASAALITVGGTHYLMQLRDQKSGIFFPGHWGLFGGAIEAGESPEESLRRELEEELGLSVTSVQYFTEYAFDFSFCGCGHLTRRFFEVPIERHVVDQLNLHEGETMRLFTAREILTSPRVVPFDSFALWMHAARHVLQAGHPVS